MKHLLYLVFFAPLCFGQYSGSACGSATCAAEVNSKPAVQTGSAAASGNCTAGKDLWVDTTHFTLQYCQATNTWSGLIAILGTAFVPGNVLFNNTLSAGTITANHLACVTASNTVGNCSGTPSNNVIGIFDGTAGNFAQVGAHTVTLDATVNVTFGDILCVSSSSGGTAHDNASTACATGQWVGVVQTTASSVSSATAILRLQ